MAFILALIYFVLCVLNLVYNVFIEKYQSGLEALMVMGITAIGIYRGMLCQVVSVTENNLADKRITPAYLSVESYLIP